jgi:hypothetical protein
MKKIALVVLALLAVLVVYFLQYFLQDEPLTPLAKQTLDYQSASVLAEQNVFVGLAGFHAAAGSDFVRLGEEVIQQVHQGQPQEAKSLVFSGKGHAYSCAREIIENCLNEIRADAENIQTLLQENHELIQRYLKIQEMPVFSNSLVVQHLAALNVPDYTDLAKISRLLSAKAILDINNGNVVAGLNWIQKDMAFYRRIFAATDANLIDKMVSLAQIRRYAILLNLLIGEGRLHAQGKNMLPLLVSLDSPRKHFREAMWREHVDISQGVFLKMLPNSASWTQYYRDQQDQEQDFGTKLINYLFYYFFYKQNMTINLASELWDNQMKIIDATPNSRLPFDSGASGQMALQRSGCGAHEVPSLCKHLKNLVGEILVQIAQPDSVAYLLRIYDTDALLRLVRVQLEYKLTARQPGVDPVEILASLPPETFNPYTEKPFDFDAERGVLVFQPVARQDKDKQVEIRLSKPEP